MSVRKRLATIAAVVAVGAAAGGIYGLANRAAPVDIDAPLVTVDKRVLASDLIVSVQDIEDAGSVFVESANRTVESWSVLVTAQHHDRRGLNVAVGDRIVVGAETNSHGERQHLLESGDGPYLLGLLYVPLEDSNGYQSEWVMRFVATGAPGETVSILHATNGDRWTTQLAGVAAASGRAGDAQFLSDWAAEADEGPANGPIQTAFDELRSSPQDPWRGWHDLDPDARALDPELTPPDVLADLENVQILVDIEDSGRPDQFLVITSPTGIVYAAALDAGNHTVTVLTAPGDDWTAFVTDKVIDGFRFSSSSFDGAAIDAIRLDNDRVYVNVRPGSGRAEVSTDAMSRGDAANLLAQWAADDDAEETTNPDEG